MASELAKRTRFLRDEVISIEMAEEEKKGQKAILGFYEAFKTYLIATLTKQTFADLYAQTITYGLFAARTRSNKEFNRELAFKFIPNTIGILRDIFRFISLEDPPKPLQIIVDDIAEILQVTDVNKIIRDISKERQRTHHSFFYETFGLRSINQGKRGVILPRTDCEYIASINSLRKSHFDIADSLAGKVTLLDPAAGTRSFPASRETTVNELKNTVLPAANFIKNQILGTCR